MATFSRESTSDATAPTPERARTNLRALTSRSSLRSWAAKYLLARATSRRPSHTALYVAPETPGAAGCGVIRTETGSGASREGRGELRNVLDFLRDGDELVVHRLDRLGRSTRDVLNLVHDLEGRGATLRVLEPDVTTAGDLGRLVVTVLGMVADLELKFIRDRQRAGIDAARTKGVYHGRKQQIDTDRIRELAARNMPKARIARTLGISRMSVYRALKAGKNPPP